MGLHGKLETFRLPAYSGVMPTYPGDHTAVIEFLPGHVSPKLKADSPWWDYAASIRITQKGEAVSEISACGKTALEKLVSFCENDGEVDAFIRQEYNQSIDRVDPHFDRRAEVIEAIAALLMAVVSTLERPERG